MVAIPLIQVALRVLVSFAVALGLQRIWGAVAAAIGHFIHKKASWFKAFLKTTVIGQLVLAAAQPEVHQGQKAIGTEAQAREPAASGFFGGIAAALQYHAFTTKYLATGTLEALDGLRGHTIPRQVGARVKSTRDLAREANRRARAAQKGAAAAAAGAAAGARINGRTAREAKVTAEQALAKAQAAGVAHPWDLPRVRAKEIDTRIGRWINTHVSRLSKLIGAAIGAGVLLRVIVRHLPWYRCSNVDRVARNLCGMNRGLLDSLLADTLLLAGSISLVTFAREVADITDETTAAMGWFIRELHDVEG